MTHHSVHRGSWTVLWIGKGSLGHSGTKSHEKTRKRLRCNSFVSLIHANCVIWCLNLLTGFWISYKGNWFVDVSLGEEEAGLPIFNFVDVATQNLFFL